MNNCYSINEIVENKDFCYEIEKVNGLKWLDEYLEEF